MTDASQVDLLWVLVCTALVFLMQGGFLCLESGLTRSKNSINTCAKNLVDLGLGVVVFWAVGFGLLFGHSSGGIVGTSHFFLNFSAGDSSTVTLLLFQSFFCGTAVTLISGAIAGRTRFSVYLFIAALVAGVIFPIFGHWAWGGLITPQPGWLSRLGFVDFAGATVVHSVGGWVALVALLFIGPRAGRFCADGPRDPMTPSSMPMAMLGAVMLWTGWLGFNGGSVLAFDDRVPLVIMNTVLAGAGGLSTTLVAAWWRRGYPSVPLMINGSLAGLVSVTASCDVVFARDAVVIGGVAGLVMLSGEALLRRFEIDDAVGAVPVHLGPGIWGTLAVAFFIRPELTTVEAGLGHRLAIQALGVAACAAWSLGTAFIAIGAVRRFTSLRVSAEEERLGLNIAEHNAPTEVYELSAVMSEHARTGSFQLRVPANPHTEVGQIAQRYNRVMDVLESRTRELEAVNQEVERRRARTERLISSMMDSLLVLSPDGTIECVNPATTSLLGYEQEEIVGQPVGLVLGEQSDLRGQLADGGLLGQGETCYVTKEQERIPVLLSASAVREPSGEIESMVCVARDITERKAAEEYVQALLDVVPVGILVANREGTIERVNAQLARLFGYDEQELIAETVELLVPELASLAHTDGQWPTAATQEVAGLRKDGTRFVAHLSLTTTTLQGRTLLLAGVVDRTEHHEAERLRRRLENETARMAGMSEVATGVLHNVGNVVNSVNISADLLHATVRESSLGLLEKVLRLLDEHSGDSASLHGFLAEDPRGKRLSESMMAIVDRLKREQSGIQDELQNLQDNVRHIVAIVASQQEFASSSSMLEEVELDAFLDKAIALGVTASSAEAYRVDRQYGDLPTLTVDAHRLMQIIVNLLSNAVQALVDNEPGDRVIVLRTELGRDDTIVISVVDNGVGILAEDLARVFEHGFTTKPTGHGFGLHISAVAAMEFGGSLTARSDGRGKGACFQLTLPQRRRMAA